MGEQIIAALKAAREAKVVASVRQERVLTSERDSELLFKLADLSAPVIPEPTDRSGDRKGAVVG